MEMSLPSQVRLGSSGLKISPVIVGCISYGSKSWSQWVIEDKEKVFEILKHCYDNGLRTFDTADMYSNGLSERLLGEFLKRYNIRRETVVILTKIFFAVDDSLELSYLEQTHDTSPEISLDLSNQRGLSRKHILDGVSKSVERLGTYVDVLQIHRLDKETPMEEIMRSLNDVVESGQVRYLGASSMLATELAELQFIAEKHGWFKFISSQSFYNLLYREDERELIPFAKKHGVGLIPWSPNARGLLTRPFGSDSARNDSDMAYRLLSSITSSESDKCIINRVEEIAKKRGVSMATVSIAWVLSKGCYPIVGLNSCERVDEAVKAIHFEFDESEIAYLEEPYGPKPQIFV